MGWFDPYGTASRFYDWFSGERLVYRAGRVAGIGLLNVQRGDVVVDIGCGTGLNFPLLSRAVGAQGLVIGLDSSRDMLEVAQRRVRRLGWNNVRLLEADAVDFAPSVVQAVLRDAGRTDEVDCVFTSYTLSVIPRWEQAWSSCLAVLRHAGRVGVVDMQPPTGWASPLFPLAHFACWLGGADIHARPWTALEQDGTDVSTRTLRGGHIVAAAGAIKQERRTPGRSRRDP